MHIWKSKAIKSVLLFFIILILQNESIFPKSYLKEAIDDLIIKTVNELKNLADENKIEGIAVWKIEKDQNRVIDTKELTNEINVKLMESNLLREQYLDLTHVQESTELIELSNIYNISYFMNGYKTKVKRKYIKVWYQIIKLPDDQIIKKGKITALIPKNTKGFFQWFEWWDWKSTTASGLILGGAVSGVSAYFTNKSAQEAYEKDKKANNQKDAINYRREVESFATLTGILITAGSVLGAGAIGLYLYDYFEKPNDKILIKPEKLAMSIGFYTRFH